MMRRINSLGLSWAESSALNMAVWVEGNYTEHLGRCDATLTLVDSCFVCTWYHGDRGIY